MTAWMGNEVKIDREGMDNNLGLAISLQKEFMLVKFGLTGTYE